MQGRSPRLVVDSSISNVTANTCLPNRMTLPRISDVVSAAPVSCSAEEMIALVLDVAKAHRRILIHPHDAGLFCFHFNGVLYQCVTLNFGARASGFYWGRVAGLMVRFFHRIIHLRHCLFQYVDDLLCWLDKSSAPLWLSLLVVSCQVLNIPMSWHKAALSQRVCWIGWSISTQTWSVVLTSTKILNIVDLISKVSSAAKLHVKDLESLIGKLLWVTNLWKHLRPLLSPLYLCLHHPPPTMVRISLAQWDACLRVMDESLVLTSDIGHSSLLKGVRIVRIANTNLSSLQQARSLLHHSRRLWAAISVPTSPVRKLDNLASESFLVWKKLFQSTPMSFSMLSPMWINCKTTADACADQFSAGFGGTVFLTDERCAWFQFQISLAEAQAVWPWVSSSMQKHISAWELLAQFALIFTISELLGPRSVTVEVPQASDNSAAQAVADKGLSVNPGMASILGAYFSFMRWRHIFSRIVHIPGHLNDLADALSRFCTHELSDADRVSVPWQSFFDHSPIFTASSNGNCRWPSSLQTSSRGQKRGS